MGEKALADLIKEQNSVLYKDHVVSDIELLHKARIHKENIENLNFILSKQYKEDIRRLKYLKIKIEKKEYEIEALIQAQQTCLNYKGYWNVIETIDFFETLTVTFSEYNPFITLCNVFIPNSETLKTMEKLLSIQTLLEYKNLIAICEKEIEDLKKVLKNKAIKRQELVGDYKELKQMFLTLTSEVETYLKENVLKKKLDNIEEQFKFLEQELVRKNSPEQTEILNKKQEYKERVSKLNNTLMEICTQHNKLFMEVSDEIIIRRQNLNRELYIMIKKQKNIFKYLKYQKEQSRKYANMWGNSKENILLPVLQNKLNYHKLKLQEVQASFKMPKSQLVIDKSVEMLDQVLNELYQERLAYSIDLKKKCLQN